MNPSEQNSKTIDAGLLAKKIQHREKLIFSAQKKPNRVFWALIAGGIVAALWGYTERLEIDRNMASALILCCYGYICIRSRPLWGCS